MGKPNFEALQKIYESNCGKKDKMLMDLPTFCYNYFDKQVNAIMEWRDFCTPENLLKYLEKDPPKKKRVIVIKKQAS